MCQQGNNTGSNTVKKYTNQKRNVPPRSPALAAVLQCLTQEMPGRTSSLLLAQFLTHFRMQRFSGIGIPRAFTFMHLHRVLGST